jgi:hypothetical protein
MFHDAVCVLQKQIQVECHLLSHVPPCNTTSTMLHWSRKHEEKQSDMCYMLDVLYIFHSLKTACRRENSLITAR